MRTTVDLPDAVFRQLKARAALEGCSLKELVLRMVERELSSNAKKRRVRLPLIEAKQGRTLALTNQEINDILYP
jgi:hypothetical protein